MENNNKLNMPCYFLPKRFLLDENLKKYSMDSKLLAGILLSSANNGAAVIETADLISSLGADYISKIIKELKSHEEDNANEL